MPDTIPSLWPDDIKVDVLTPLMILRAQAGLLSRITKGILEAEVVVEQAKLGGNGGTPVTQIHLDLIAPALNRSGYRILTTQYSDEMAYPTHIQSNYVANEDLIAALTSSEYKKAPSNEKEFINSVSNILRSSKTMSLIQSLIARSNEQLAVTQSSSHKKDEK